MACLPCARHLHFECDSDPCCCVARTKSNDSNLLLQSSPTKSARTVDGTQKLGRPKLSDDEVTDPLSTGRKRASFLYPLDKSAPCEWRRLKNCGGGKYPITGCLIGMQKHRHHGPDKEPMNNSKGNVHRICNPCHNRWHDLNDHRLDIEILHSPVAASVEEVIDYDMKWKNGEFADQVRARMAFLKAQKNSSITEQSQSDNHPVTDPGIA